MYTKIIQNTGFVYIYILYIKTVQIKISYDIERSKNVDQILSQKNVETLQNCAKCKLKIA